MHRQKDKLERYIKRYIHAKDLRITECDRSTYYRFNDRTVRISDHVSKSSDGDVSIIFDSSDKGYYIVHAAKTNELSVITYEEVKLLIKSISLMPPLVNLITQKLAPDKKDPINKPDKKDLINKQDENFIMGVPKEAFTNDQLQGISVMVKKVKKKLKK